MQGETEIERLFREEAARIWPAVPELVQECRVTACGSNYHLDFAVPSMMIAVELDGWETHHSPTAIAYDRRKKRDLEDAGWRVRYYGGQEVTRDAAGVVRNALRWAGLEPVVPSERVPGCDHILLDDDGGHFCARAQGHNGLHATCGNTPCRGACNCFKWKTGFDGELGGRHRRDWAPEQPDWSDVIRGGPVFDAGEPTDFDNALAVLARVHPVLRYDPGTGRWLVRGASGWHLEGEEATQGTVTELRLMMPPGCADPENDPRFAHLDADLIALLKRQAKNYERFATPATVRDIARLMKAIARRNRKEAA